MISFISILTTFAAVNFTTVEAQDKSDKCKILSLKGGGIHGAWEAGVLKGMTEAMPAELIDYDHIAGVSIGAINSSIFSIYPKG